MLTEVDARALLAERKIERDILETRTCAQIVEALGLVSMEESLIIEPVMSENARIQAENMTRNVRQERAPYFVR